MWHHHHHRHNLSHQQNRGGALTRCSVLCTLHHGSRSLSLSRIRSCPSENFRFRLRSASTRRLSIVAFVEPISGTLRKRLNKLATIGVSAKALLKHSYIFILKKNLKMYLIWYPFDIMEPFYQ